MAEYIKREEVCKLCNNDKEYCGKQKCPVYKALATDAVEVVRCKDCKHCTEAFDGNPCCGRLRTSFPYVRDDDFCSYGERRTDG